MGFRCTFLTAIVVVGSLLGFDSAAAQGTLGGLLSQNSPETSASGNAPTAPGEPYFDLDHFRPEAHSTGDDWSYQSLPNGLVYRSYLANPKDSRLSTQFIHPRDNWLWDATVGGRFGVLRYGTRDAVRPEGFQWDVEGSGQVRLDLENNVDVQSVDFRGGTALTYGVGRHGFKFGYYHLSSHLGDEFLLKNPGFPRLNYARDVLVVGYSIFATPDLRFFAEGGWAFYTSVSKPWEFQFGTEWVPSYPTGPRGAPFVAVHGQLREELDFGGTLTAQAGWAWRGDDSSNLLRAGFHYQNGGSSQLSFYRDFEQQVGFGLWFDR